MGGQGRGRRAAVDSDGSGLGLFSRAVAAELGRPQGHKKAEAEFKRTCFCFLRTSLYRRFITWPCRSGLSLDPLLSIVPPERCLTQITSLNSSKDTDSVRRQVSQSIFL